MNHLLRTLNSIKYDKLIWVLAITETIHNIEEAIWLPDMFQSVNGLRFVSPFEFRLATLLVTLLIWWITWYFVKYKNKLSINLMGGTLFIILFNVFMPHIIGSIILQKFAPGVISGILLNIPVTTYLLWRGFKEGIFNIKSLVVGSIAFAAMALPVMLGSFFFEELLYPFFHSPTLLVP